MNNDTGEIRRGKSPGPPWVPLELGEVVDIKGCPCRVVFVDIGRQRLTLQPIGVQGLSTLMAAKSRHGGVGEGLNDRALTAPHLSGMEDNDGKVQEGK